MPPTTGYANDPVNTASGNFVELEDDLPFDGLTAGLRFARMYNSRSEQLGRVRAGLVLVGRRAPDPARRGRRVRRPGRAAGAVPAHGRRATGACWASPGWSSRAQSGLVLRLFGGERWDVRRGRPAARGSRAARAPTSSSRTRTGALAELRHSGGRSGARALGRRAHRGAGVLGRAHREPTATTTRARWSRPTVPRARAITRSATRAGCCR